MIKQIITYLIGWIFIIIGIWLIPFWLRMRTIGGPMMNIILLPIALGTGIVVISFSDVSGGEE